MSRGWTETDQQQNSELLSRLPTRLCKYAGLSGKRFEYIWQMIVKSTLWAERPTAFNDPLDCKIPVSFDAPDELIRQHWVEHVRETYPENTIDSREATIRQLVADSHQPSKQAALLNLLFHSVDQNGIICLTPNPLSMTMWSYYAEGHSGICLVFNTEKACLDKIGKALFPLEVQYEKDLPKINFYEAGTISLIRTLFGVKSYQWTHEDEWRIVFSNHVGTVQCPRDFLSSIIFGIRTSDAHKTAIRGWNKERHIPVPIYNVRHVAGSFELELVEDFTK